MTSDEQEALSRRYFAAPVLRLESGRFAIFAPGYGELRMIVDEIPPAVLDFIPPPPDNKPVRRDVSAVVSSLLANFRKQRNGTLS